MPARWGDIEVSISSFGGYWGRSVRGGSAVSLVGIFVGVAGSLGFSPVGVIGLFRDRFIVFRGRKNLFGAGRPWAFAKYIFHILGEYDFSRD